MRFYKALSVLAVSLMFFTPIFSATTKAEASQFEVSKAEAIKTESIKAEAIKAEANGGAKSDDRVGLAEIKKMASVSFESGNYRLDPDFKLGYGDTVNINLWGKLEGSYKLTINRDGAIFIPTVGKINIMGMNLDEAHTAVKREFDKKYSNVELDLSLTDVRDIRVAVLGNVQTPGSYVVSPFSRMVDIIAKSGGPNDKGSVSDIRLIRDDKEIISFNIYDFVFKGDQTKNLRLRHGDIIYVPQAKGLIYVAGDVWYPGRYEIESITKLSNAITISGGMRPSDIKRKINIFRVDPKDNGTKLFKEISFDHSQAIKQDDDVVVKNGDTIIVTNAYDRTLTAEELYKIVSISGQVNLPGSYMIKENETLGSLIKRAGGLKDNAFVEGAVFTRSSLIDKQRPILDELVRVQEKAILEEAARLAEEIMTQEEKELRRRALEYRRKALNIMASRQSKGRIVINFEDVINGKADLVLAKGDIVEIPPIPDWVMVAGAVYNPESIAFSEGKGMDYYLNAVGGLTKTADKDGIYVIKPSGYVESKTTGYGKILHGDVVVVPEKI